MINESRPLCWRMYISPGILRPNRPSIFHLKDCAYSSLFAAMSSSRETTPTQESQQQSQLDKFEAWTEDASHAMTQQPIKDDPTLMEYDESTLREGLIYATAARRDLMTTFNTNTRIRRNQHAGPRYTKKFEHLDELEEATNMPSAKIDTTFAMNPKDDVADYAAEIQSWQSKDPKDNLRRLRYTISVTVCLNARMRAYVDEFSTAIGVAQKDIEAKPREK